MKSNAIHGAWIALLLAITGQVHADEAHSPDPIPNCSGHQSPYRDFDFWVGEWEVFDPSGDRKYGNNSVQKKENGCLILEQWASVDGTSGISMNFYDPLEKQWRQVWQNAGFFIDYSGGLDDQGRMQLEGTIFYHANGQQAPFRGRWTKKSDGSVLQEFWQYNSTSSQWDGWFRGLYKKTTE